MRWSRPGSIALACVAVALLSFGPVALPNQAPGSVAHPAPAFHSIEAPLAASEPTPISGDPGASSTWSPASGHSSPGMPNYRLTTLSRTSASCSSVYSPGWLAYDVNDASFWVATAPNCVDVFQVPLNYTNMVALPVGLDPFGVAVDAALHEVFISNTGSDNVTVIDDTTLLALASIGVGRAPMGVTYDNATGDVYVANSLSNNVTVIDSTTLQVVATVSVGSGPVGIVADPGSRQVFVANNGSNNVCAISDTTYQVVASVNAGGSPWGIALDPFSDSLFVSNAGTSNVTVIDAGGDFQIATIPVLAPSLTLQGAAFNPTTGLVWIAAGTGYIVVLNSTSLSVAGYVETDPSGVAYDPDNGFMCVTNSGNISFACLSAPFAPVPLTFAETGLVPGTTWSVDLGFGAQRTNARNDTFGVVPNVFGGPGATVNFTVPRVQSFLPVPASGSFPFTDRATVVNISFIAGAGYYAVEFQQTGLPNGTSWSVNLNGSSNRSTASTISFWEPNATAYPFVVTAPSGYTARPAAGNLSVDGANLSIPVSFTASPLYTVTFLESGLPNGTLWGVALHGASLASTSSTIQLRLVNGTYGFAIVGLAGFTSALGGTVLVQGQPVTEVIVFSAAPTPLLANFTSEFQNASCLPDGSITNNLLLNASATGGTAPYEYVWLLPTGAAYGPTTEATTTWPWGANVTLIVTDSAGHRVTVTRELPMSVALPCPPPPPPLRTLPIYLVPGPDWRIGVLATAVIGTMIVIAIVVLRYHGGRPGEPPRIR